MELANNDTYRPMGRIPLESQAVLTVDTHLVRAAKLSMKFLKAPAWRVTEAVS
jgi:hypothetical protein